MNLYVYIRNTHRHTHLTYLQITCKIYRSNPLSMREEWTLSDEWIFRAVSCSFCYISIDSRLIFILVWLSIVLFCTVFCFFVHTISLAMVISASLDCIYWNVLNAYTQTSAYFDAMFTSKIREIDNNQSNRQKKKLIDRQWNRRQPRVLFTRKKKSNNYYLFGNEQKKNKSLQGLND